MPLIHRFLNNWSLRNRKSLVNNSFLRLDRLQKALSFLPFNKSQVKEKRILLYTKTICEKVIKFVSRQK